LIENNAFGDKRVIVISSPVHLQLFKQFLPIMRKGKLIIFLHLFDFMYLIVDFKE